MPGILDTGYTEKIQILLANKTNSPMDINKGQPLSLLNLHTNESMTSFQYLGDLTKFGLPINETKLPPPSTNAFTNSCLAIIPREKLNHLTKLQQDKFLDLLDKFKDVFAKDDLDLGCAKSVKHVLDAGDNEPLQQQPYRKLQSEQLAKYKEVQKLLKMGLIILSKSP